MGGMLLDQKDWLTSGEGEGSRRYGERSEVERDRGEDEEEGVKR